MQKKKFKKDFENNESIGFLTNRVAKMINHTIQFKMNENEIGMAQEHMIILFMLWKNDGASQKSIVNNIFKDKSTITRGLSYLEKENLIVRITDEKDKRNKKIFLTHKGKALQNEVIEMALGIAKTATKGISEKDYETCKSVLIKIFKNLEPI